MPGLPRREQKGEKETYLQVGSYRPLHFGRLKRKQRQKLKKKQAKTLDKQDGSTSVENEDNSSGEGSEDEEEPHFVVGGT